MPKVHLMLSPQNLHLCLTGLWIDIYRVHKFCLTICRRVIVSEVQNQDTSFHREKPERIKFSHINRKYKVNKLFNFPLGYKRNEIIEMKRDVRRTEDEKPYLSEIVNTSNNKAP